MKTALVIGAAGAVGQALVAKLRHDGQYLVIPAGASADKMNEYSLDLTNREQLILALSSLRPDVIFNVAGSYSHILSEAYAVNVEASRNLLEALVTLEMLKVRVVLIGSAAEYGIVQPRENPINENHVLRPISVYGLSKAWQTQLVSLYSSLGVDVVLARPFNLYGANISDTLFVGRVYKEINEVIAGKKSFIEIGSLSSIRDYISIPDAVNQLCLIATHGETGNVYHIASGVPISMRQMLQHYLEKNNLSYSIVREDLSYSNRIGYDVPEIYADISKTISLINQ